MSAPSSPPQLTFTIAPNDATAAYRAREDVRALAEQNGLGHRAMDVCTAVTELIANALEHGHPPVTVTAAWDGTLTVDVFDRGTVTGDPTAWGSALPRSTAERGRGLWIVRQLTDSFEVHSTPRGTRVRFSVSANGNQT